MAEKTTKKKSTKKLLGLSPYVWAGLGIGAGGIYYYLHKRSAAAATAGTTDGQTTPGSGTVSGTTSSTPAPTTLSAWINAALTGGSVGASYTSSDLLNDINDWLSGNCVSSTGYSTIGNLVSTLGVPPGYSTTPVLSVCAGSTSTSQLGGGAGAASLFPPTLTSTTTAPASKQAIDQASVDDFNAQTISDWNTKVAALFPAGTTVPVDTTGAIIAPSADAAHAAGYGAAVAAGPNGVTPIVAPPVPAGGLPPGIPDAATWAAV